MPNLLNCNGIAFTVSGGANNAASQARIIQFNRAACAITSIASGWRERTLSESAPQSSQAR